MKKLLIALVALAIAGSAFALAAARANVYQATGPVLALTPSVITIQKGEDKWEIGRDASPRSPGT